MEKTTNYSVSIGFDFLLGVVLGIFAAFIRVTAGIPLDIVMEMTLAVVIGLSLVLIALYHDKARIKTWNNVFGLTGMALMAITVYYGLQLI